MKTPREVAHAIQDRYLSTPNFGHWDLIVSAEEAVAERDVEHAADFTRRTGPAVAFLVDSACAGHDDGKDFGRCCRARAALAALEGRR